MKKIALIFLISLNVLSCSSTTAPQQGGTEVGNTVPSPSTEAPQNSNTTTPDTTTTPDPTNPTGPEVVSLPPPTGNPSSPVTTTPPPSGTPPSLDTVTYTGNFPASSGSFADARLTVGGLVRDLSVYRPNTNSNLPLLIFFSGTGNSADLRENDFKTFADAHGVVVAIPQQRNMNYGDWDNHSSGTPYWQTANADGSVSSDINQNPDLLFVRAILKEAIQTYQVNAARVYSAGFSNGAFFSYFVAMTLKDRIAAFAETSGGLVRCESTGSYNFHTSPRGSDPDSASIVVSNNCSGITLDTCSGLARPIAVQTSGRKVPAYLFHNDDDDSVSPAYTCRLYNELQAASYNTQLVMRSQGGGHVTTQAFLNGAWNFMKNFSL